MHRHLTERPHNDICRDAADNVGQQYAGSGHFNGVGRAVKSPVPMAEPGAIKRMCRVLSPRLSLLLLSIVVFQCRLTQKIKNHGTRSPVVKRLSSPPVNARWKSPDVRLRDPRSPREWSSRRWASASQALLRQRQTRGPVRQNRGKCR